MTSKEFVLETLKRSGKISAQSLQERAKDMDGTELYAEDSYIPEFSEAVKKMNMLDRLIGFVCKSSAGRVVRLIQNYNSDIFTGEPEELPAQFGFVWSKDPDKALPFIAISTSPFMIGECCTENGVVYRSTKDNNVHSPTEYPDGWEVVTDETV